MRVDTQRDRRVSVAELPAHIRNRRPVLQQQRCEGVPHLVWTAAMETRGVQHAVERLAHVRFVERRAGGGYEYPFGQRLTATEPFRALSATP